jgi:nucleotide-binding universal stress UspA family protein
MPIQKILFATNFGETSFPIVQSLCGLKKVGLEEVVFLYVIERDEVAYHLSAGFDREQAEELGEEARLRFQDWEASLAREGVSARHVMVVGDPEGKILETAAREKADLIALGRHPLPLDAFYPLGIAMGVLRRASLPVFVYPLGAQEAVKSPFDRICFATDFNETSPRTIEFLGSLKGLTRRIEVAHVVAEREVHTDDAKKVAKLETADRERLDAVSGELREMGFDTGTHLLAGEPAKTILAGAADLGCTAIVLGTKGLGGLEEAFHGSVSHRVVEGADIPVVLVPLRMLGEYD